MNGKAGWHSIDSYGATTNWIRNPGVSQTQNTYGLSPTTITTVHPLFSNQSFSIGATTFSAKPSLSLTRYTDAKYGSGAAWFDGSGNLFFVSSIFPSGATMVANGSRMVSPPPTRAQQATALGTAGVVLSLIGVVVGLIPGGKAVTAVGTMLGLIGTALNVAGLQPCPSTPRGRPTNASGLLDNLDLGNVQMLSGGPEPVDGGGQGIHGSDQLLMA